MKKILLAVAVVAAMSVAACGGKEAKAADAEESALATKIENCTNPDSLSVYVDQAKAYAQKLVQEGKVDEAKKYLDKITPVVQEKAPALVSTLETVKSAIDKLPGAVADSTKAAAEAAVDSVKGSVSDAADAAKAKAGEAVQSAADAGSAAVDKAKENAGKAVSDAASKANDAINNALKR